MNAMLQWYYPFSSADEWAENKMFTIKECEQIVSSNCLSEEIATKFINRIFTKNDEVINLINYLSLLNSRGNQVAVNCFLCAIHDVCTRYCSDICKTGEMDATPLPFRLITLSFGMPMMNYKFLTDDYYKRYAHAINILYTILNGGCYFEEEYVAQALRFFVENATYVDSIKQYQINNEWYMPNSPYDLSKSTIMDFITRLSNNDEFVHYSNAITVIDYLGKIDKFDEMVTFISGFIKKECKESGFITNEKIETLCKNLMFQYSDMGKIDEDDNLFINELSDDEVVSIVVGILKDCDIDLVFDKDTNTSYCNLSHIFHIAANEIRHRYSFNVSPRLLDIAFKIFSDPQMFAVAKMYYKGTDVTVSDLVDVLEKEYQDSLKSDNQPIPVTEAKKEDYSKYNWDDDDKSTDNEKDTTDNKPNDDDTKETNKKKSSEKNTEEDIPMHGTAKLKGMEKGIKRSNNFAKTKNKVYMEYAKYKQQEQKIDSQVSKVVLNAGKVVAGVTDDQVKRRVVGNDKFSVVSILKRLIGTYAIFSFSKIGAVCLLVVRVALGKFVTDRERIKIINELESEIEIVDEKIQDARGDENKEAKYALMRTKNNLQNAVKKIKYGGKWNQITLSGIKNAKSAINDARGES